MTHQDPDVLQDGEVTLRPARPGDADAIVSGLNDFEVSKWTAVVPHPFTHADLRLTHDDGTSKWPGHAVIDWKGACVGIVSCTDGRLGYWVARPAWGQGIMSRAARLAVAACFAREPDRSDISACVFAGNPGSVRVLEKLGFARTDGACTGHCRARGEDLPQINFRLTRAMWEATP